MKPLDLKLLIFDFDLTLIDSFKVMNRVRDELSRNHNLSYKRISEHEAWGSTVIGNARMLKERNPETNLSPEEIEKLIIDYSTKHFQEAALNCPDLLRKWIKQGKKFAIVSGNTKEGIKKVINSPCNAGIIFDPVLITNATYDKTQRIQECLKHYNFKESDTIYIGDHLNDIVAAKKAGVYSCAACTGFHTKDDFDELKPDIIIDDLSELDKYLS